MGGGEGGGGGKASLATHKSETHIKKNDNSTLTNPPDNSSLFHANVNELATVFIIITPRIWKKYSQISCDWGADVPVTSLI